MSLPFAAIRQIAVLGEAVAHHVIGRLVAEEAAGNPRHVDAERQTAVDAQDDHGDREAWQEVARARRFAQRSRERG